MQAGNKEHIILIGGGGHCKACIDVLEACGAYAIKAIVDMPARLGEKVLGYAVEHTDFNLADLIALHKNVLICIGQIKTPEPRIIMFKKAEDTLTASEVLKEVYHSLQEKGYNPINQIVGYLISGDPTYITSYNNARSNIRRMERDELIEELVKEYVKAKQL